MTYMTFDLETQTHKYLKRKASCWHPDNYIVAGGWKVQGDTECSYEYIKPGDKKFQLKIPKHVTVLVGFNIKFDLLWQWDNPELVAFFKRGGRVWDCQYVEYLLGAQEMKYQYCNLNETAPRYGGTEKIDEVKILWDAGVQTSDINKDLIIDYLVGTVEEARNGGDIGNTEKIFLGQLRRVQKAGMGTAIRSRMDGLCATTEMEWNGLKIDIEEFKAQFTKLTAERRVARAELVTFVPELPPELKFSWASRTHKSCLIYGGVVKYAKRGNYPDKETGELARLKAHERRYLNLDGTVSDMICEDETAYKYNVLTFKSGQKEGLPKTKKVEVQGPLKEKWLDKFHTFKGYTKGRPEWKGKQKDAAGNPLYSTAGDTIQLLRHTGVPFCEVLSEYEALDKEINTYFLSRDKQGNLAGMGICIDPLTGIIHHSLNHCATITARLSSSDPNLQNVPRGDKSRIKAVFISRFPGGNMIEADYSQLEVVVQGVLTKDSKLLQDLRDCIDFHCKRVALQPGYNITYDAVKAIIADEDHKDHALWKKRRTNAKIFSFQRAYGGGASLIALSTGMDVDDVKALIVAEDLAYPGVPAFYEAVADVVDGNAVPFRSFDDGGKVFRRGYWTAPTGCQYTFRTYTAPDWLQDRGVTENFKPTEIKNYPIQGTGGEIVQGTCGMLWRHFVSNDNYGGKALLCNTVHDCVWVDTDSSVTAQVGADVKRIMEQVDDWFLQFGVTITVPFPVDVEAGPNMLELKHLHME